MDYSELSKKHSRRVIISEVIMTLTVIVTVALLVLISSGYWLSTDLKVERQGMLQIHSQPTGATVVVDGAAWNWLERTNTSKVLSAGEHTITLEKDGYDSWSRTINITEGLLYRIHYPRLFLQNRTSEAAYDLTGYTLASTSPDGRYMLLLNNTTEWLLLNLESDSLEPKKLNIADIFASVSVADGATTGLFTGEITSLNWSQDSSRLLVHTSTEWVILAPRDPKNSLNLTKALSADFTDLVILDNSASTLLAVKSGNLYKIDVGARQISPVIVENIISFDHYGNEIFFVAKTPTDKNAISSVFGDTSDAISSALDIASPEGDTESTAHKLYYAGLIKLGDTKITPVMEFDSAPQVAISRFYDDKYLTVLQGDDLALYEYDDFSEVLTHHLDFTPAELSVGHDGEFIEFTDQARFATLDMEALAVREWTIDSAHYGWLDTDMLYSVKDGHLYVYDFDGENRRELASGASSHFPVTIAADKWLYYVSDGQLIRELVR